MKYDALEPSASLLCKLGSIIIHTEELYSPSGHGFDKIALEGLLKDPEVILWIQAMDSMSLLPKKRKS